jgi:glycosyltransferase involved in cell wall biosynthesis
MKNLAVGLRRLGVASDLCCLDKLECPEAGPAQLYGTVRVLHRRGLVDREALGELGKVCRAGHTRIVHAHDAASQFTGALLRLQRPGLRLLMTFHRSLGFESARLRDRLRNAFAIGQSSAIVTGSQERREHFLRENRVRSAKVYRIPFGIDTRRFRPDPAVGAAVRQQFGLDPETIVLGAVGHFGAEKGIDVVLRAYAQLVRRPLARPMALVVVGDGEPARRDLVYDLARACNPARVVFAGFRPDVDKVFAAFDVLLHAPRLEAFGLVLVEAMATGLPLIATRVGGIPEIVREGQNGLLVPPDDPEALANAAERLITDAALRQAMAATSRSMAEREYDLEAYARGYLDLYQKLVRWPHRK